MNDVSQKKKDSIMKSLAIAGFLGIIILIAWLSIQLVQLLPSTFSSLASLAEGIDQYQQSVVENEQDPARLNVTSDRSVVNAGGAVTLTWETTETPGSYTFAYDCAEGVAVDILTDEGERSIACNKNYNIGDIHTLNIRVDSEKERFTDLRYTVSFLGTNDTIPRASGSALLTVHNSDIVDILVAHPTENDTDQNDDVDTTDTTNDDADKADVTDTTTSSVKPTPVYEQEYVYAIPTSDPNGQTDLATKFLALGKIVGDRFFTGEVKQHEPGAVQFEVRNLGNKTSNDWTYEVTLPGGIVYTSPTQNPLKPNERAVITVGFAEAIGTVHVFKIDVSVSPDKNSSNDHTTYAVSFK